MAERLRQLVGYVPSGPVNRLDAVKLKRFRSAKAVWTWYLKPMMDSVGETDPEQILLNGEMGATEVSLGMTDMGFWGFYHPKTNTISYWIDKKVSTSQAIAFFAHELFHAVQDYPSRWKTDRVMLMERRADLTGLCAARAYRIVQRLGLK